MYTCNFIYNSQKLKTAQVSINKRLDKQNGILSNKMKQTTDTCTNMDESHYTT